MIAALRVDFEIARRGYARYAAYRAATIAGLFTNTVFGFLRSFILLGLYEHRAVIGGYDATATLTYTWLTQALMTPIMVYGWRDLALRIRSGDIATDLVRPIEPLRAWLAFDLGRAFYHFISRGIPPFLLGTVVFRLAAPGDLLVWLAFLVSVVLAVVVSFAFRFLYNAASFWLADDRGMAILAMIAVSFFSGFLVPVAFFPDWLAAIARATPFPSMLQLPIDIFIGTATGPQITATLAVQLAWAVALLAAAQGVFALGTRRLVVQGG